jgi:hypothetical protein
MYNRHYDDGFTRVFTNDLYNIEERIQDEVDPDLYIMWNPFTGEHLVMDNVVNMAVMKIPQIGFETLDSRLIPHLQSIRLGEGYSPHETISKHEAKKELESEKKFDDLNDYFAREVAKTVR